MLHILKYNIPNFDTVTINVTYDNGLDLMGLLLIQVEKNQIERRLESRTH